MTGLPSEQRLLWVEPAGHRRTAIVAMKLVRCWDDGVTTDVRLAGLLRRHGARAPFNLNAGLHGRERQ